MLKITGRPKRRTPAQIKRDSAKFKKEFDEAWHQAGCPKEFEFRGHIFTVPFEDVENDPVGSKEEGSKPTVAKVAHKVQDTRPPDVQLDTGEYFDPKD